jgi:hypothetical protein
MGQSGRASPPFGIPDPLLPGHRRGDRNPGASSGRESFVMHVPSLHVPVLGHARVQVAAIRAFPLAPASLGAGSVSGDSSVWG